MMEWTSSKVRGAGEGIKALIAELIAGELTRRRVVSA
jgi:hypothetical protein